MISEQDNTIKILNYSDFTKLIAEGDIEAKDVVFWVGSGIDFDPPTKLPLASNLMQELLSLTCGDESGKKILDIWKLAGEEINNLKILREDKRNEFAGFPRLESIIEELLRCESNMRKKHEIMPIIQCFKDAPPNANHYALANAIIHGADVFTTNYSLCIQSAFRVLTNGKFEMNRIRHIEDSLTYIYQSSLSNAGKIYHIHGVAAPKSKLGASLGSVKNKLPQVAINLIDQWMVEKKLFVFCGYSGSDSFDVNRYFLSKTRNCAKATALFIRHTRSRESLQAELYAKEKEKILLGPFRERGIVLSDTTLVLARFDNTTKYKVSNNFNWKEHCKTFFYPTEYRKNLQIKLCAFLGISIALIIGDNWIPSSEEEQVYLPWYTDYPCFAMARLQDNVYLIEKFGKNLKANENSQIIDNIIRSAKREFPNYSKREIRKVYEKTKQYLEDQGVIDWNISTLINQHINSVVSLALLCKSKEEIDCICDRFNEEMLCTFEACNIIIEQGYDFVSEMNQLHLALRDAALLTTFLHHDFKKAIEWLEQSTYDYIEVSSIDGVLGNLNAAQIIFTIESVYTGSKLPYLKAKDAYKSVKRICGFTGFKRHESIADQNLNFINRFNPENEDT